MAISIVKEDNRLTVEWQEHFTISLPDTPSNRKSILAFLRTLKDEKGKHMFTFQELSALFDSNKRQASSQHMEDFRDSGCDFLDYLTRKRKVDCVVVESVRQELMVDPLANLVELRERVNAKLERKDLTEASVKAALEQIPYESDRGNRTVAVIRRHKHLKPNIASFPSYDTSYPSTRLNFRLRTEAEIFDWFSGLLGYDFRQL